MLDFFENEGKIWIHKKKKFDFEKERDTKEKNIKRSDRFLGVGQLKKQNNKNPSINTLLQVKGGKPLYGRSTC